MSKIPIDVRLNPVWHKMLYSCTHMATVGVEGLRGSIRIGPREQKIMFMFMFSGLALFCEHWSVVTAESSITWLQKSINWLLD